MSDRDSWQDTFRALGQAVIDVLRAEMAVISETWQRSARELGKAAGILVVVAYLGLILVPSLLLFALLTGLHSGLGWPLWAAALAVAALVVVVCLVLARIALHLLQKRFESPVATVQNRFADHRAWWSERILGDGTTEGDVDEALDTSDRAPGEPPPGA